LYMTFSVIIPAPNVVSAHQRHKVAHTMRACEHGIIIIILTAMKAGLY